MGRILNEWIGENAHRNYPISDDASCRDTSGVFEIPRSLMLDVTLTVPAPDAGDVTYSEGFFVDEVTAWGTTVDISISFRNQSGVSKKVGSFLNIDPSKDKTTYTFSPVGQTDSNFLLFQSMSGQLITGHCPELQGTAGNWQFTYTSTPILSTCIAVLAVGIRQLIVGGKALSGDITLRAGRGVTMTVTTEGGQSVVTLNAASSTITGSLASDSDVIQALTELYGIPIVTINNIAPASTGNFTIAGDDCTSISGGTNAIQITNPCAKPCCDPDTYLADAYDNLNELNVRYARIQEFHTSVQEGLNQMQNQLAMLKMALGG